MIIIVLIFIMFAAILNAYMDYLGFKYNSYGFDWHFYKILMQGCYMMAAWCMFIVTKGFKYQLYEKFKKWQVFLIFACLFALITWIFHDLFYHVILT